MLLLLIRLLANWDGVRQYDLIELYRSRRWQHRRLWRHRMHLADELLLHLLMNLRHRRNDLNRHRHRSHSLLLAEIVAHRGDSCRDWRRLLEQLHRQRSWQLLRSWRNERCDRRRLIWLTWLLLKLLARWRYDCNRRSVWRKHWRKRWWLRLTSSKRHPWFLRLWSLRRLLKQCKGIIAIGRLSRICSTVPTVTPLTSEN